MSLHAKVNGAWQEVPDAEKVFVKVAGAWSLLGTPLPRYNDATGGVVTTYTANGKWFRVHTFTASGDFTVTTAAVPFRTLVCPGGGGGGVGMNANGGGKGRGGKPVISDTTTLAVGTIPVVVGGGGGRAPDADWQPGAAGGQSSLGTITANGGSGGGGGESPYTGNAYSQNANIEAAYNDPATWVSSDITGAVAKYGHDGSWGGPQYEGPNGQGYGGGGRGGGTGWGNRGNPTGGNAGVVIVAYEIEPPTFNDATGGTVTEVVDYNGTGQTWRVHEFGPGAASLVVNVALEPFRYLLTGGGGGGAEGGAQPQPGMPGGGADVSKGEVTLAPGTYSGTIGAGAGATSGGFGSGGAQSTWNGITVAGGPPANAVSGHNGVNAGPDDITGRAGLVYGQQGDYKGYNNIPGAGNGGGGGRSPGEWGFGGSPGALIIAYQIA